MRMTSYSHACVGVGIVMCHAARYHPISHHSCPHMLPCTTPPGEFFPFVQHADFTESLTRHYFAQLMEGVAYLHSKEVCHRDLSLENILLDGADVLKICDFGLAVSGEGACEDDGVCSTCVCHFMFTVQRLAYGVHHGVRASMTACSYHVALICCMISR